MDAYTYTRTQMHAHRHVSQISDSAIPVFCSKAFLELLIYVCQTAGTVVILRQSCGASVLVSIATLHFVDKELSLGSSTVYCI
jgi:hypothetical protein